MENLKEYIRSGIIELYVLGLASDEENAEIEKLAAIHPEIRNEIDDVSESLLKYGQQQAPPDAGLRLKIKPMVMATIDYTERLKNGEAPAVPPLLSNKSTSKDFSEWTSRGDMFFDESYGDAYAKIIGYTPEALTAIVWLKTGSPYEMHDKEYEKFLVLEGSCEIVTKEKVFTLATGDYFSIPLHVGHTVEVTSEIPCKLILQRVAA